MTRDLHCLYGTESNRRTHLGGGGGVITGAYKCIQGGRGSEHDQKYAFCTHVY